VVASSLARVREPQRNGQIVTCLVSFSLTEDLLPPDHPARLLWTLLGQAELHAFYAAAKSVTGRAGRKIRSAHVKLCLWGYAISRKISSAREIARLCKTDLAFCWICAGEPLDHSTLSLFRTHHTEAMDQLLTQILRRMQTQLGMRFDGTGSHTLAQDGTKEGADAAMGSFRRRPGLEILLTQAALHAKALATQAQAEPSSPGAATARQLRSAQATQARQQKARQVALDLQEQRAASSKASTRKLPKASTTDPDARVMRMPHGGYEPAYNIQLAAVGHPLGGPVAIVGVRVSQETTDQGSVEPMLDQIEARIGQPVKRIAVDSNHLSARALEQAERRGTKLISRPPKNWKDSKAKKKKDE
jgi:transposase